MNFGKPKYRPSNLRKEETREELLSQAKQARQAREQDRSFLKSALAIQRIYRGHLARQQWQQVVITDWLAQNGRRAADTSDVPTALEIAETILPPVLHLHLPFSWPTSRPSKSGGGARKATPTLQHKDSAALLLSCFGLSHRSCTAAQKDPGYLENPDVRKAWTRQMQRLMQLAGELCGIGKGQTGKQQQRGGGGMWGMIESLAARLLFSLTHWPPTCPGHAQLQDSFQTTYTRDVRLLPALHRMLASVDLRCGPGTPGEDQGSAAVTRSTQSHDAAVVNVLKAAVSTLESGEGPAAAHELDVARELLGLPNLLAKLPETALPTLRQQHIHSRLAGALSALAESKRPESSLPSWIWMLVNFAELCAGKPQTRTLKDGKMIRFYQRMELLSQPSQVLSLLDTGAAILDCAAAPLSHGQADMTEALSHLTLFADGTFVNAIVTVMGNDPSRSSGIPSFAAFYHRLLDRLLASHEALQLSVHNALAFGSRDLLPRVWRWLAQNVGLPLEAPREATRGWDIQALRHGAAGLSPQHAAALELFCRIYAHHLLVVDDEDFHNLQQPFSLAQQRAIATALNTLAFRSHSPDASPTSAARLPGKESSSLKAAAATLLSALYQRDVRRPFCPPALWLAPYQASTKQSDFAADKVVNALLAATAAPDAATARQLLGGKSAAYAALLMEAPQCIPFDKRVEIFRCLVEGDKERLNAPRKVLEITVRREALLEDGFAALRGSAGAIKGRLKVQFVNLGVVEPGMDAGGLVKEFLEEVVKAGFNADYGLMTATAEGLAYPQPASSSLAQGHQLLEFLGLMLGKALYEGILLDWPLAPFFVSKLQGRRPVFDELSALDPDLHHNLLTLKRYEGDAEDLGLTFAVEDETFGRRVTIPLLPGGADLVVTSHNRLQYVQLAAEWHLNGRLGGGAAAFARGINQVIPTAWLRLFNPREVNQLLAGGEGGGVEVEDLQRHTEYSGGYTPTSSTIKLFWQVVRGMSVEERQAMLKFVTSCSRAPLGGFAHLRPPFQIQKVACPSSPLASLVGKDVERLPSAATCFNTLKLPNYKRSATLRRCLVYAVTSNSGFELS